MSYGLSNMIKEKKAEREGHFPIYGWFLTGNCTNRIGAFENAQTGQEEGNNTEETHKLGTNKELIHSKHSPTVVMEATIHIICLTVHTQA